MLFKSHPVHEARSAGTSEKSRIKVNDKLIRWAEIIFVMEQKHKRILKERFPMAVAGKKIVVLEIEDNYFFGDEELIITLKNSLAGYL